MIKINFVGTSLFVIFLLILLLLVINSNYNIENFTDNDNITVVSGYWKVNNKYNNDKYNDWFKNTLKINQQYIFFCNKSDNEFIKQFRNNYETEFIDYKLDDFYSKQYYQDNWIDKTHVPSKEIGMIWNEKIHLLKIARDYNIVNNKNTQFYIWIDAGISSYRDTAPPNIRLNLKDTNSLPHDKLCYSHIDGDYHSFSGGVLLIHESFITTFHDIYYKYLNTCQSRWKCGSDQFILTNILKDKPELFYKMSEGYGQNLVDLYNEYL